MALTGIGKLNETQRQNNRGAALIIDAEFEAGQIPGPTENFSTLPAGFSGKPSNTVLFADLLPPGFKMPQ